MENGRQSGLPVPLAVSTFRTPCAPLLATFSEDRFFDAFWWPLASLSAPVGSLWARFGSLLVRFWLASVANICRFLASDRFAFIGWCPRGAAVTLDFTIADPKGLKKVYRYMK